MSTLLVKDNIYQTLENAANSRQMSIDDLLEELAKILDEEMRAEKFEQSRKFVRNRYQNLYLKLA